MRILINTAILRFGGAIQGALSIIYECRNFLDHEYHVFVGQGVGRSLNKEDFPPNFYFYDFDFDKVSLLKIPKLAGELSKYEKRIKPDCVITTTGPSYWHTKAPQLMGYNLPLYIYPESPYFELLSIYRRFRYYIKRWIHFYFFRRDASAYFVQTDEVNRRVRKDLKNNNVFTITNTYNGYFLNPRMTENKLPQKKNSEIRLLTLTSYYKHKNIDANC